MKESPARDRVAAWCALPILVVILAWASIGAGAEVDATPGQVVRWTAAGIERCAAGERTWPPLGETCWFPVDLLTESGFQAVSRLREGQWETAVISVGDYPYPVQRIEIADRGKVDLSPENVARAARERFKIDALWETDGPPLFEIPLASPLADPPPGGRFGSRRFINGEPRSPHTGADYAADEGTPALAVAAGRVVLAEEHFFAGNSVFLDHGAGLISMYFHLSSMAVEVGASVRRGETLGRVGSTGRATGPHLHFGLRWRGARIDPEILLRPEQAPVLEE